MHPQGFKPFFDTLKSPWNIIFLVLGGAVLADFLLGSQYMMKVVEVQLHLQKLDIGSPNLRIMTLFGVFTKAIAWARFVGTVLFVVLLAIPLWSILGGLYGSIMSKRA
jgi:heme/copper-type cytochrome/quinol oxidase subunit 4